jgi:pimeloyl-ACP methyl ester carboxylesterase
MKILMVGSGMVGLCAGMLLADDGHDVTLLERDPAPPPGPSEAWSRWERRGVNQFRLPNFFVSRFRITVEAELPRLGRALEAAGACRYNIVENIPDVCAPVPVRTARRAVASANGWANFRAWSRHPDADAVIAEMEANRSLTPGLNWYRANAHPRSLVSPARQMPRVAAPTMGVWSTGDIGLAEQQMTRSGEYVAGQWRYERLEGPGHWVQWEAPGRVNALLLDFLDTDGGPAP